MQLLLSSGGNSSLSKGKLQTLNKLIKDLFTGIDEVIFISYAQKNRKEYTKRIREKWWPLKNVKLTGIEEYENPIDAIAEAKPRTLYELEYIRGLGPAKISRFGQDIIEMVDRYSDE